MPATARGQIFVTNDFGRIGEYTTSGATINALLVTGLNLSPGIAVSGSNLFVVSGGNRVVGTVGEYTTSGAIVNASLVSGLVNPECIALSGSNMFVVSGGNRVGEFTTLGATVNASLITAGSTFDQWRGVAVYGDKLFVTDFRQGTVGEYTTSGATVNASLITGLASPADIKVFGGNLFVTDYGSASIGEYTMSGATVNASLISDGGPRGIAIVPEPSSLVLAALGFIGLAWRLRRR
jgi:hypothetical protein